MVASVKIKYIYEFTGKRLPRNGSVQLIAQAFALGAALAIHKFWNSKPVPAVIFDLKLYSITDGFKI